MTMTIAPKSGFVVSRVVETIDSLREAVRDADVEARQLSADPVKGMLQYIALEKPGRGRKQV